MFVCGDGQETVKKTKKEFRFRQTRIEKTNTTISRTFFFAGINTFKCLTVSHRAKIKRQRCFP